MKKLLLFLLMILLSEMVSATRAWVGPILYDFNMETKEALVDSYSSALSGDVSIPYIVTYGGIEYHVVGFKGSAFANCSSITSVTISEGIKSIDYRAFYNCNNLSSISIPYSCIEICDEVFCDCVNLTSVTIPEGVKSIGYRAFAECTSLSTINIPNSVTAIGYGNFEGSKWYDNQPEGILYLDNCLIGYKGEKPIGKLKITDGTRLLADKAFLDCSEIVSTIIPQSVIHIGSEAFSGCTGMMSASLSEGLISINYSAFSGCNSLTTISIPNSVTDLSASVFSGCSGLSSVNIGNGVKVLNSNVFSGCSGLTQITIPDNVELIRYYAFQNCTSLKTIEIPNSVSSIEMQAFSGCSGLTSVTIGNNVTSIGNLAFGWCESLESITIPSSLTSMGESVFYKCYKLSNVYISDIASWCKISFGNEESFPQNSYKMYLNGTEVNNLIISNNISSIPDFAFKNCSSIKSLTIPNNISIINESSFQNCTHLETVKLPDELQIIKKAAFQGCSSLKSVIIPSFVEFIYQEAFANCYGLESVNAQPTTPPFLYDNSFSDYSVPLNVPSGCLEAYQAAQGWSNFTNVSDRNMYYQLSITATGHGTATCGTTEVENATTTFDVAEGANATITITPDDGYSISSVIVGGVDKTSEVVNGVLTLSNVTANVTVAVTFAYGGEMASVAIGSTGMATYCSTSDLDFSEVDGLKVYIGAGFNRTTGKLTMLEVTDVPAGTGLIVKGNAGTYEVPVKASASIYANLLEGVTTATNISQTADGYTNYILGNGANGVGFYLVSSAGGSLSAGKAYLRIPTVLAGSRSVIDVEFSEGVTGIDDAGTGSAVSGDLYTLSGQRLEGKPTKAGMYVKNGRVVIIK